MNLFIERNMRNEGQRTGILAPRSPLRRIAVLLGGLALGMLAGCATGPKPPAAPAMEKPAQPVFGEAPLAPFFCLNAITPFHHKVSPDPSAREALWTTLDKQLALAAKLGATHVRVDMWWGVIEPEKGKYDWDFPDRVMQAIVAAGLEPYPILCYNAAWSPDASPATPEQREEFGEYVYQLVNRYKDKVRQWEVWNEPNIQPFWVPQPDPGLYAELLKVANGRAKEADPTCAVVAMCTAGADYEFIEGVYKNGAQVNFDALSFHHYGDTRDESVLEGEIRRIRRIMDRHGDGQKPLLITELGLSTGPSTISRAYSEEEQASWMVKKHMIAIAEGVSGLYWFKMKDDATEANPDGYWGLLRNDYTWKPSARAYGHMTGLLSDAWFVGKAHRITEDADRQGDVEFLLFRNSDEVFACAWVRDDGGKVNIRLPATGVVPIEDLDGKTVLEARPKDDGSVTIPLTKEPRFLRNLSLAAIPLAAIRMDPDPVYISPGETKTVTMSIENPLSTPLAIDLNDLLRPPARGNLSLTAPRPSVEAPPETLTRVTLTVSLPPNAPPFAAQEFVFSDPLEYSYAMRVEYAEPFHIQMLAQQDGKRGKLTTYFTNRTDGTVSGTVSWKIRDESVAKSMPFHDLKPGATASVEKKMGPALSAATFTAIVTTDLGAVGSGVIHVVGQPWIETPPAIDGDLADWADVPAIHLDPANNQVKPADKMLPANVFGGDVKVAWTADRLYVAADVVDAKPFVNPHTGTNLWRGDSMELYLGFGGPTLATHYAEGQYHIGISPGDKGENPTVWNWNPARVGDAPVPEGGSAIEDATVAVSRSEKGYRMEASIPLASLGVAVQPSQFIGFDASLNDLNNPSEESNEAVLIWNGRGMGWKDPSTWGVGVIIPREEKK